MKSISDKLDYGYELATDEDVSVCSKCKKKFTGIRHGKEMFYCEQDNKVYCYECMIKHKSRKNHVDWNITRVNKVNKGDNIRRVEVDEVTTSE